MAQSSFSRNQRPMTQAALLTLLVRLSNQGGIATAVELDTTSIYMGRLLNEGLVAVADTVKSGKRGRPAYIYEVTKIGYDRAYRAGARKPRINRDQAIAERRDVAVAA